MENIAVRRATQFQPKPLQINVPTKTSRWHKQRARLSDPISPDFGGSELHLSSKQYSLSILSSHMLYQTHQPFLFLSIISSYSFSFSLHRLLAPHHYTFPSNLKETKQREEGGEEEESDSAFAESFT
jgi:hypothetical protein